MFRDDHDAALARANALEAQVERLTDERAELQAENARLAAAATTGRPTPIIESPAAAPRRTPWLIGGALAVVIVVAIALASRVGDARRGATRAYNAAVTARDAGNGRWHAALRVEPCVRDVAYDQAMVRSWLPTAWTDADAYRLGNAVRQLIGNCLDGARTLAADTTLAAPVRDALTTWLAAEADVVAPTEALAAYLGGGDWQEDHFAAMPAHLAAVERTLAARHAALTSVRRDALPALREVLRAYQHLLPDRDLTWWRLELGLAMWDVNETSLAASGVTADRPIDEAAGARALRQPVAAYLARATTAPIELRREIRQLDWLLAPLAAGEPLPKDGLWHLAHPDADPSNKLAQTDAPGLPPLPPRPPPVDD